MKLNLKRNETDKTDNFNCWDISLQYGAFAVLLLGLKLWLIGSYGNAIPFWDQWGAEAKNLYIPYLEHTLNWGDLFAPHNEHRIFMTRVFALAQLSINGIWNPLLQMVFNAGLHIATLIICIELLSRVVGRKHLPALLFFSIILFGIPYAWQNTLWGMQSSFYFVSLFSVVCLWLTVINAPLSTRWWGGVISAMFAFISLASGIFALAAAAIIGLGFYVLGLRKTRKQLIAALILAGLFMFGVALTPTLALHASLKAASFIQFFDALTSILGWPISHGILSAIVRNLPALVFVGFMAWKRPPANDRNWFLLALVIWVFGQAVSLAYGRASDSLASRYKDLFAIGILVNFACLLFLIHGSKRFKAIVITSIWMFTVIFSLGRDASLHIPAELASTRDNDIAYEINTRNYLNTGDINYLQGKPIPYHDSGLLASILSSTTLQEILPTNIRRPMVPVSIKGLSEGIFVTDGVWHTTPRRFGLVLGSYDAQQANPNQATGQVSIQYRATKQDTELAIPVAGYIIGDGGKLEIEQNGQRHNLQLKSDPKESWQMVYANVNSGEFSIILTDSSAMSWVAVGAPLVTGNMDSFINHLLANYQLIILFGLIVGGLLIVANGIKLDTNKATSEDDE